MAITFVADTENAISNATTATITAPAGIANGDLLVAVVSHWHIWNGLEPVGWTCVSRLSYAGLATQVVILVKTALATDTTWTLTFAGSGPGTSWCGAYRGSGWVQMAQIQTSKDYQTTCTVLPYPTGSGVRLDILHSRKDTNPASLHGDPAWATRRANFEGTNSTNHMEVSVVERTIAAAGMSYQTDVWAITNASTVALPHTASLVWVSETIPPAEMILDPIGIEWPAKNTWVYKGRILSTDDTPEVP